MNNNQNATGGQVIELMTRLSGQQLLQVTDRFEQIITCQISLMLQRGVPPEKLIEIVQEMDKQMKAAASEEMVSFEKASGQE